MTIAQDPTPASTVLELVICTVRDQAAANAGRLAAMKAVATYPGFLAWRAVGGIEDEHTIADLVEWASLADAKAAAQAVRTDPRFAPYMQAIDTVIVMQHFTTHHRVSASGI